MLITSKKLNIWKLIHTNTTKNCCRKCEKWLPFIPIYSDDSKQFLFFYFNHKRFTVFSHCDIQISLQIFLSRLKITHGSIMKASRVIQPVSFHRIFSMKFNFYLHLYKLLIFLTFKLSCQSSTLFCQNGTLSITSKVFISKKFN